MFVTNTSNFDAYRLNLLIGKIKNTKAIYDADLQDLNTYYKGYRYNNDERIAHMILGNIFNECQSNYVAANAKFLSLDSIQIEPYIKAAVLESASADHWYLYEKQW